MIAMLSSTRLTDRLWVVFTIPNLEPGNSYTGPTGTGDDGDLCKCNTVVYSLMSACDACQGAKWFSCVLSYRISSWAFRSSRLLM